ncbi:DgyrCDS6531 [Dimorphilus gyrociliatus]|uniref:DgyrCDS6531 n=1 Tax=Dimorphilus gyrociliatus TaxID=2664684 RepID=A0A7I8VNB6_9ANNE|nr:DgyrCDS6531 [Dimorphilus gyrociliatus]
MTDYLVCGVCQTSFFLSDMAYFINHKRFDCDNKENAQKNLQCSTCLKSFQSPWSLLKHIQNAHNLQVYYEGMDSLTTDNVQQTVKTHNNAMKDIIEEAVSSSIQSLTNSSVATSSTIQQPISNTNQEKVQESGNCKCKTAEKVDCKCCESNTVTTTAESPKSVTEEVDINSKVSCLRVTCCCSENGKCQIDTVMQKCCSSIVPKKRPRHFMKHLEERQQNEKESTGIKITAPEHDELSLTTKDTQIIDINSVSTKKKKLNGNKAFMCEVCGEGFNQRIHLKKHMSKHTGIKPYKCDQCNYATVERSHLKVHNRIHTGEKPFKCNLCDYATAQNSTLKIHMKRHHSQAETNITSNENHQQQSITMSQDSDSLEDLLMLSASLLPA